VAEAAASAGLAIEVVRFPAGTRTAEGAARAATGYAIGGVPPLGHAGHLPVLIDEHLLLEAEVWAAAGLPDAVFRVAPDALERATKARRANLAADPA
jgi:prolyl-tRNA editing enzyme YbaK/EbsC (Cys-tRNA(Pro) deacylase)